MATDDLGGLADVARALNHDEEWELKKARTEAEIREAGRHIEEAGRELQRSVSELHREPTAEVALTEQELRDVLNGYGTGDSAGRKFAQALAIESGPGGRFVDPA